MSLSTSGLRITRRFPGQPTDLGSMDFPAHVPPSRQVYIFVPIRKMLAPSRVAL